MNKTKLILAVAIVQFILFSGCDAPSQKEEDRSVDPEITDGKTGENLLTDIKAPSEFKIDEISVWIVDYWFSDTIPDSEKLKMDIENILQDSGYQVFDHRDKLDWSTMEKSAIMRVSARPLVNESLHNPMLTLLTVEIMGLAKPGLEDWQLMSRFALHVASNNSIPELSTEDKENILNLSRTMVAWLKGTQHANSPFMTHNNIVIFQGED